MVIVHSVAREDTGQLCVQSLALKKENKKTRKELEVNDDFTYLLVWDDSGRKLGMSDVTLL